MPLLTYEQKNIVMTQGTSQLRLLMCTRLIIPLAQTLLQVWCKQNFELIHVFMALPLRIYKSQGAAAGQSFPGKATQTHNFALSR